MTVGLLIQVIASGIAAGAVYGLIAVAHSLVYRLTGVIHLALGELMSLTVFLTILFAAGSKPVTQTNVDPLRFLLALLGAMVVSAVAGLIVFALVRPFLAARSTVGWAGLMVALALGIRGVLQAAFVQESYVFPDPIPFRKLADEGVISLGGGAAFNVRSLFVIVVAIVLAVLAAEALHATRPGKALRAIAADRDAARLVGLPIDRLLGGAFALAGVLAGLAAIVAAPGAPFSADVGSILGLKGLVAAMVGRFAIPWPAFVAGLALGLIESSITTLPGIGDLGAGAQDVVLLLIAFAVLFSGRLRSEARSLE